MNNFLFSSIIVLTYIVNISKAVNFKVICAPFDYGGTGVSVNIDGTSYPMTSTNNDIYFEYTFNGTPKNYYYEITGTALNELSLIETPRAWDSQSDTTLNEVYGRQHTIGDSIIQTIPRLYEKLEGYDKYSLLFQEGEVPVINVHLNPMDYNELIGLTDNNDKKYSIEFELYTPYEKYHFTNATFKLSGQGSVTQEKKPYKIDLSGNEEDKQNSQIYNRKEFKLRSLRYDESYIKNKLAGDIAESLGLPIVQTAPCRLYINNKSYGLYEISDMYKKKFLRRFFNPPKNGDDYIYGSLYKGVSQESYPAYLYSDFGNLEISKLYENIVPSSQNPLNPYADLQNMMAWLNSLQPNASKEEIEQKFDVDMFLKYALIEYLTCHWDGYLSHGNNFFVYVEPNNGKYHFLSYDFDMSFGKWCEAKEGTIDDYVTNVVEPDKRVYGTEPQRKPLLYSKILTNPNIRPQFDELVKNVVGNLFNIDALGPRIDYFFTFLKNDMYWDVDCINKSIETKAFQGADVQEVPTIEIINQQYSDIDTDPENMKAFIKFKSTNLSNLLGIQSFNKESKFGTVGNKIIATEKSEKDDESKVTLHGSSNDSTINKPTVLLLIISFLFAFFM